MIPALSKSSGIDTDSSGFEQKGNYYYYDHSSAQPPRLYQQILSNAEKSIDIWDPFFTKGAAHVFEKVTKDNICINILTKLQIKGPYDSQTEGELNDFVNQIKSLFKKGAIPQLDVYCYKVKHFDKNWHDRYLIIDDKDVYLVGTSMDAQVSTDKDFGIYHIVDKDECELIKMRMKSCKDACTCNGYHSIGYHKQ